jgi:hypothetical protein
MGAFPGLGNSLHACKTHFLHCIISLFYSLSGFYNMKETTTKKEDGKESDYLLCLATIMSLFKKELIFESLSYPIGFRMA